MYDLSVITEAIHSFLSGLMPTWLCVTVECVLIGVGLLLAYSLLALFYIY